MDRPVHVDCHYWMALTTKEQIDKNWGKHFFPNSFQGNRKTHKQEGKGLRFWFYSQGGWGKSRSMFSYLEILFVLPFSHLTEQEEKNKPSDAWECWHKAGKSVLPWATFSRQQAGTFKQDLKRKPLCLIATAILHSVIKSLLKSICVFSSIPSCHSKPSNLIMLCMERFFPVIVLNLLPDHLLCLP